MKRIIIIIVAIIAVVLIYKRMHSHIDGTRVMGHTGVVTGVENGNTITLDTGLKVYLLGIAPGHERTEVWLKENLVGKIVEVVSDSGNEQTYRTIGETVKAYVVIIKGDERVCVNRLLLDDTPDCYSLAYMNDSTLILPGSTPGPIHDKALYMKQRTMLVKTESGLGTAFFINKQGVALTNHHVLNGSESACVYLYAQDAEDSNVYSSRRRNIRNILWTSPELDITIFSVELEHEEDIPYFNLISRHESQGNECYILGNPQGLIASFAKGVISAYRDDDEVEGRKLVQYDIATNGGNSGGPVMNNNGEIIAVHAMGRKEQTNGTAAQGLNFGIDILQVRTVLDSPGVNVNYGGK